MTSTSYHHRSSRVLDPSLPVNARYSTIKPYQNHRESKKQKPTPFDPDDLCRRLQVVLAEEKAYAERKRRSRANIDRPVVKDDDGKRIGREVPLEITAYQATATKSAQVTAARRSVLSSSAAKRRSKATEEGLIAPPEPPEKEDQASYHHVPSVAATQFARTTAHELSSDKSIVHKLSRKAMKFHMEGPNARADTMANAAPDEQAKMMHRVREEREKTYGRNQFQHPAAILEAAGDVDDRQDRDACYRQTFDSHFRAKHGVQDESDQPYKPRLSSSSARAYQHAGTRESADYPAGIYPVLSQDDAENQSVPTRIDDHRVDWTQSDEKTLEPLSPTLRKADSRWTLRGRLSFHRGSKSEKEMLAIEDRTESPMLRPQRSSFFARFKR